MSADDILKYFYQIIDFNIICKLSPKETVCIKCQSLISGKSKKNNINLLSAKFAQTVVKVNHKHCDTNQQTTNY